MIKKSVFLGSKKFGFELFKALFVANKYVEWKVICPPDLHDSRSYLEKFEDFTAKNGIELHIMSSPESVSELTKHYLPDVMIVCGYYRILPSSMFKFVSKGVWGIHNSLLPEYRGGSPLVWQIINEERLLGSSFFRFADGMDDGPVLAQVNISNEHKLTISDASDRIENEWLKRIPNLWSDFCNDRLYPQEQDHSKATYCAQRQEYDGVIDWRNHAGTIDAFIRAQSHPYPRAFFQKENQIVRVISHEVDSRKIYGTQGQVFEVKDDYVTVCCGDGSAIRLIELQVDGKVMKAKNVLNSIKIRLML